MNFSFEEFWEKYEKFELLSREPKKLVGNWEKYYPKIESQVIHLDNLGPSLVSWRDGPPITVPEPGYYLVVALNGELDYVLGPFKTYEEAEASRTTQGMEEEL